MARYCGNQWSLAALAAADASMVSELQFIVATSAHSDSSDGETLHEGVDLGSVGRIRSRSTWRSSPWDPDDGGDLCKNQLRDCHLDGLRDRRSFVEGQYALQPQSIHFSSRMESFAGVGIV